MVQIGPLELAVVLVIALLVLGPRRLPEVARSVGKGVREFRESLAGIGADDEDEDDRRALGERYQNEADSSESSSSSSGRV